MKKKLQTLFPVTHLLMRILFSLKPYNFKMSSELLKQEIPFTWELYIIRKDMEWDC